MNTISIPIKILCPNMTAPEYAYSGDAGVDLRTARDFTLKPFERMAVPCGISVAIPEGYAGFVIPRSGLAIKHGISVVNAPGLIDSNYRGEIKAILVNLDAHHEFHAHAGDRIAQLAIVPVAQAQFQELDELNDTVRGSKGFGSSGVTDVR